MVPMNEATNLPSALTLLRKSWSAKRGLKILVSTTLGTSEILSPGTCHLLMRHSRNAGVTTTMRSAFRYRNAAIFARERCSADLALPTPTATSDSGQRSRTSKINGTCFSLEIHQPARPTSNCGELAITASGAPRKDPVMAADARNEL